MCIYHCMPVLDYDISGQHPQLLATSVDELPIPEFDNIGMEGVPLVQLLNSNLYNTNGSINDNKTFFIFKFLILFNCRQ